MGRAYGPSWSAQRRGNLLGKGFAKKKNKKRKKGLMVGGISEAVLRRDILRIGQAADAIEYLNAKARKLPSLGSPQGILAWDLLRWPGALREYAIRINAIIRLIDL